MLGRLINGQMRAIPLSEDHKPDRPDERQRILEIGGQVNHASKIKRVILQ